MEGAIETDKVQVAYPWWQPGVLTSALAISLWICTELPPDMLDTIFHAGTSSDSFRHVGDTLFVVGWTVSGALMWSGRRRIAHDADVTAQPAKAEAGATGQPHGLAGLRQSMARRWERMRHPIPLH